MDVFSQRLYHAIASESIFEDRDWQNRRSGSDWDGRCFDRHVSDELRRCSGTASHAFPSERSHSLAAAADHDGRINSSSAEEVSAERFAAERAPDATDSGKPSRRTTRRSSFGSHAAAWGGAGARAWA